MVYKMYMVFSSVGWVLLFYMELVVECDIFEVIYKM